MSTTTIKVQSFWEISNSFNQSVWGDNPAYPSSTDAHWWHCTLLQHPVIQMGWQLHTHWLRKMFCAAASQSMDLTMFSLMMLLSSVSHDPPSATTVVPVSSSPPLVMIKRQMSAMSTLRPGRCTGMFFLNIFFMSSVMTRNPARWNCRILNPKYRHWFITGKPNWRSITGPINRKGISKTIHLAIFHWICHPVS